MSNINIILGDCRKIVNDKNIRLYDIVNITKEVTLYLSNIQNLSNEEKHKFAETIITEILSIQVDKEMLSQTIKSIWKMVKSSTSCFSKIFSCCS